MLSNLAKLKAVLGIADASEDVALGLFLAAADSAIKQWCNRDLESQAYTHYFSGDGRSEDLLLIQRPVSAIASLWIDPTGYYGDGPNAFDSTKLKAAGTDYVLVRDNGSLSDRGIVRRIGAQFFGGYGGSPYQSGMWGGTLSGMDAGPKWDRGNGNIKVQYTAGYTVIPADLANACHQLAATMRAMRIAGRLLGSENYIDYAYTLLANEKPGPGSLVYTLAQYREISMGGRG